LIASSGFQRGRGHRALRCGLRFAHNFDEWLRPLLKIIVEGSGGGVEDALHVGVDLGVADGGQVHCALAGNPHEQIPLLLGGSGVICVVGLPSGHPRQGGYD
jgi:hypothetical protein